MLKSCSLCGRLHRFDDICRRAEGAVEKAAAAVLLIPPALVGTQGEGGHTGQGLPNTQIFLKMEFLKGDEGMGRPAKPVDTQSGNINSDVKESRKSTEDELKGRKVRVSPSFPLTKEQKRIFARIKKLFEEAELLGELDSYVLTQGAVVIDRLQEIDRRINDDPDLLFDMDVCNTRKEYMQSFFRICNELSLSPQARAKMGILAAGKGKAKSDPIFSIFGEGADGQETG